MVGLKDRISSFFMGAAKSEIIKVFSLTSLATLVKMVTSFVSVKIVSLIVGPAGIALLGQLNNFSSVALTLSNGGLTNGITKYVSEFKEYKDKIKVLLSNAFRITIFCSGICGVLMIVFNRYLSNLIFLTPKYYYVFIIFGVSIVLYALNTVIISVLNGYKEFRKFVLVNIAGSIIGLIFTVVLVIPFGLPGALISAVTFQSVSLFVTFLMVRKMPWMSKEYIKSKIDFNIIKGYLNYTLMAIVTAMALPLVQFILRSYIITDISPVAAGWWEGMNRISAAYLMIITSSFSVYYLPKLSETRNNQELRHEVVKAFKVVIPILFLGLTLVYFIRNVVVRVLYTPDFLPMCNLFLMQLVGDFFRISTWLLSFVMVAKTMTKTFILIEVISNICFLGLAFLFIRCNGILGVVQGYAVNCVVFFMVLVLIFRKLIFSKSI